jgi:hypothetical protein
VLVFTQPLTEMSSRSRKYCFWRVERGRYVGLTTFPPSVSLSIHFGIVYISQPHRSPRPVTKIVSPSFFSRTENEVHVDVSTPEGIKIINIYP